MDGHKAEIEWRDSVPVSRQFSDPYYSLDDGLAETRHVFLDGNDLPQRFRPGFVIAELGFGTGLNAASALASWRRAGVDGPLTFVSFEAFPLSSAAMVKALGAFPELAPEAASVLSALRGDRQVDLNLRVILGDVNETLRGWTGAADAWFLDGFSPDRNPAMWGPDLLAEAATHTAEGGTAATYSAAGHVRRGLESAGFLVERSPGFGRKRHMTRARLR
ncbi:MAG: tRNA (5-methylaminomethyl-2-thiouridine)(34)-methyltransferase MnmD [Pseudomonadota bacterium]